LLWCRKWVNRCGNRSASTVFRRYGIWGNDGGGKMWEEGCGKVGIGVEGKIQWTNSKWKKKVSSRKIAIGGQPQKLSFISMNYKPEINKLQLKESCSLDVLI
jgi:hypothetical protein